MNSYFVTAAIYTIVHRITGRQQLFAFAKKPVLHEGCAMLKFCMFISLTECAQRTQGRLLSSPAVLRCGQSATKETNMI